MPITRTPIVDDDGSGTTGTVLDNAWKQELYNQIDAADAASAPLSSVLGHASGTLTDPNSNNFSGYVGNNGLLPYDTLTLEIELHSTIAPMPGVALYFVQASSIGILNLNTFGNPAGGFTSARVYLRRHGALDYIMHTLAMGGGAPGAVASSLVTLDTGWSKAWAVVMNCGGVPAGNSLYWKWNVMLQTIGAAGAAARPGDEAPPELAAPK